MKLFSGFWRHLCAVYTVTSLLFLLLNWMIAGSFDNTVIRPEAFLLLLPFAAGVALATVLYAVKSLSHAWRLVLHFAVCTLSAYLFLYLPAGTAASGGMKLLMLMLIMLLYWIIMGAYLALTARRNRKSIDKTDYQSVYKK